LFLSKLDLHTTSHSVFSEKNPARFHHVLWTYWPWTWKHSTYFHRMVSLVCLGLYRN